MDNDQMPDPTADYYACLLRLWRDHPGATWRVLLIETAGGAQHSFATLAELYAFVEERTGGPAPADFDRSSPL